ncbi:MAG TPA: F0F1 ATP synthase subunit epsilon [Acidimicrobiales bacterium]|nr:F0F1 ATP synthase subunit epsilon [Acidimicrobiales bacterium]
MADGVFAVELVTPEEKLLDTRARAVVLRSSDGDLTVLDGHTPLVTDIVAGEVRVDQEEGEPLRFAVHGGFLQVGSVDAEDGAEGGGTLVTVLAGVAEAAERIDVARAERARTAASARVEELRAAGRSGQGGGGPETGGQPVTPEELELARAEAAVRRAEVRLAVAGVPAG